MLSSKYMYNIQKCYKKPRRALKIGCPPVSVNKADNNKAFRLHSYTFMKLCLKMSKIIDECGACRDISRWILQHKTWIILYYINRKELNL